MEEEEYDRDGFDEEDERESAVNNRRFGGRYRGVRNREEDIATFGGNAGRNTRRMEDKEDNNHPFKVRMILRLTLSGRRRWS